jgi:hypothetical protein
MTNDEQAETPLPSPSDDAAPAPQPAEVFAFKPSVGRIVHILTRTDDGMLLACKAALITRVVDPQRGMINAQLFDDDEVRVARNILPGSSMQEGRWHVPERD